MACSAAVLHRGCTPALQRQRRDLRKTKAYACCGFELNYLSLVLVLVLVWVLVLVLVLVFFVGGGVGRCACALGCR